MAGRLHRSLLAASAWRRDIIGVGHTPRPLSTGGAAPLIAPRLPEVDNVPARRDDLLGDGKWPDAEVLRYGGLVSAAYDAFDKKTDASRCVGRRLLPGHGSGGYVATVSLYSTVDIVPGMTRNDRRHWIGYVAVAAERDHAGYRDIAVVWRGTEGWREMIKDFEAKLVAIHGGDGEESVPVDGKRRARNQVLDELRRQATTLSHGGAPVTRAALDATTVQVAYGFDSLYTASCATCDKHGKLSAKRQVLDELRRLVEHFREKHPGEKIRVTATGHSLGGALALLAAPDVAQELSGAGVPVSAVTFGAPLVGNRAFCELLTSCGVRVLRVVTGRDIVPTLPPESMGYVHAGDELKLDAPLSLTNILGIFHRLRIYLDLLRVRVGETSSDAAMFRWNKGDCDSEKPAPEPDTIDLPLKLSKLDEMIFSEKEMMSPRPRMDMAL
ncbi:hypothetical protein ACP70R_018532 [Stipagrostis hirtigluma subsp. patula]